MSVSYFRRYFDDLSAYCLPKGASKLFCDSVSRENALHYEKVRWIDLSNDQRFELLMFVTRRLGNITEDNDIWLRLSISALLTCVNYLLEKNGGKITWFELCRFFQLSEVIKAWESEDRSSAKRMLHEFLDLVPGWPHNMARAHEQFGYMSMRHYSSLNQISLFSRKRVDDLALYLGGSRRLGGDARLSRAIGHMFSEVGSFACLREPVIDLIRDRFDQQLLMRALPSWAKGQILENDLGL